MSACQDKSSDIAIWVKPESTTISCAEYYNVETKDGIFTNNVWNKHAAKQDPWSQCLEKRTIGGSTQYGWSWSWPRGRRVVYSQPQIKVGSSPWAPEPKFDSSFPLKISDLTKLSISHDIEVHSNGQHNTATTMWLTTEPYKGNKPKLSIIAVELMVWTYSTANHFNPAGRKRGELRVGDMTWEVWYQKDWEDKSMVNNNNWISVSFKAGTSSMKAEIPALTLLNYAIQQKLIPEGLFVADVELGNEIMSGDGIAWVKTFRVIHE